MLRTWLTLLLALPAVFAYACTDGANDGATGGTSGTSSSARTAATSIASDGGAADASAAATTTPQVVLGPDCDEDNPQKGPTTAGSIDRMLPDAIVQFERSLGWGCAHRQYHETRLWDYLDAKSTESPDALARLTYAKKRNWVRATKQEGTAGSGLSFLTMHRAMLGTLRDRFPEHAQLFDGWASVPLESTTEDPVANAPDASAPAAFYPSMKTAVERLANDVDSFATDDELGIWIETQHRPTPQDPLARASDTTSGLHTYIHVRFDDVRSPIRMQRFSRNSENETFFRLHGWVDAVWTRFRNLKGFDDATDAAYGEAMDHACTHMGLGRWDRAKYACLP